MRDVIALLEAAEPYLSAVARAYGTQILNRVEHEASDAATDATIGLGRRLLAYLLRRKESQPALKTAVMNMAANPDDAEFAVVVRAEVRKALVADDTLADQWMHLLAEVLPTASKYSVTVQDSQPVQVGEQNTQTNTFGIV